MRGYEMGNNEDRIRILRMIEEGKITAEEGVQLIAALTRSRQAEQKPAAAQSTKNKPSGNARWLRVRVSNGRTGRQQVNVNLPLFLVDIGLKIGARYAPELEGIDFKEISQLIREGAQGKIIDVTDDADGDHVEIFVD
jgi:hypothetical protein